jgi:flagellar basal-body rod protein FlgC
MKGIAMKVGNLFQAFKISASGLTAQRARLNVISANIANAEATRTAEGGPYKKRTVSFSSPASKSNSIFERVLRINEEMGLGVSKTSNRHLSDTDLPTFPDPAGLVQFNVAKDDKTPGRFVYEPGHPDANAEGYVEYPNVEVIHEMVDLLGATRAYEANVSAMGATKAMLKKALEI